MELTLNTKQAQEYMTVTLSELLSFKKDEVYAIYDSWNSEHTKENFNEVIENIKKNMIENYRNSFVVTFFDKNNQQVRKVVADDVFLDSYSIFSIRVNFTEETELYSVEYSTKYNDEIDFFEISYNATQIVYNSENINNFTGPEVFNVCDINDIKQIAQESYSFYVKGVEVEYKDFIDLLVAEQESSAMKAELQTETVVKTIKRKRL